MTNLKTGLVVLFLSTFCFLTGAYAQITPSADASTSSLAPFQNYGSNGYLYVRNTTQLTYIQFDLSTIPAGYTGSNIAKASLKLYIYSVATAGTLNVDYVTSPWAEKTITFNNPPTLGGFIATSENIALTNAKDYVIVDITPAVQAWLNGTESNNGIALVGNGTFNAGFESKENNVTSHPPELDIVFASGIGTITGVTTANGSGLTGGGTSGTLNLSLTPCLNGQVLASNGSGWTCSTVSGGAGTVTSVGSGTGLIGGPITTSGALAIDPNVVPLLSLENQFTASQSVLGSLNATYLGASGTITAGGGAVFPSTGNSPTSGSPSSPLDLTASASNGATASYQTFRWQAANVDGGTPSANLNLLFGAAGATPQPTGLSIAPNGIISFASGQTFGGGGGGGGITSVTGTNGVNAVTSGGAVTLNADHNVVAFQTDLTAAITTAETTAENYASANFLPLTAASSFATIGANVFSGNQTITGNLFASGNVGIGTTTPQATLDVNGVVNAATSFDLPLNGTPQAFVWAPGGISEVVQNTAVGWGAMALWAPNGGGFNTAIGSIALQNNNQGAANTALGYVALENNTSGSSNTANGAIALSQNLTGSYNSAFGYDAGPQKANNLSNATAIGAFADVEQSNSLVLGSTLNQGNCNASNNCQSTSVGIGTATPQSTLDVHGNTSITGNLNVTGTVTCGSGCGGGGGGGGTITGVVAGTGLSGGGTSGTVTLNNTGVLNVSPGTGIAIGGTVQNPIVNINTNVVPVLNGANSFSGNQNVNGNIAAAGTISGTTITGTTVSAFKLIATGALYLNGNTTNPFAYESGTGAGDNTFLGFAGQSVNAAAPGDENTAVGSQALNVNGTGSTGGFVSFGNTAVGAQSLVANTLGNDNTASGYNALGKNTSGGSNTASGTLALFYNVTGSNNTALGYNAGSDTASPGLTNSTAIGANAVVSKSNSLVLGGTGANAVDVGIGTATPQATLDVEGLVSTPPTVNFGSASVPATLTVNGTLNVNGTCNGCGGGGGGVTNVIAGTDLTGGGSGPTVTLNLNTSATDLRYSQLGATNTFTSTQTINTSTGNGISATSSAGTGLYGTGAATGVTGSSSSFTGTGVYGTATGTGIGVTGTSPVQGVFGLASATSGTTSGVLGQSNSVGGAGVTGLNLSGGGSGVLGQGFTGVNGTGAGSGVTGTSTSATGSGVVGIENSGGGYAGYFQGDVAVTGNLRSGGSAPVTVGGNAAVNGNLVIGGDLPMSHSPRMSFYGAVASFSTSPQPAGFFIPDQPIIITRITASVGSGQNSLCNVYDEYITLTYLVSGSPVVITQLDVANQGYIDSGTLNYQVPAGAQLQLYGQQADGVLGCQSGNNISVNVEYAMQ